MLYSIHPSVIHSVFAVVLIPTDVDEKSENHKKPICYLNIPSLFTNMYKRCQALEATPSVGFRFVDPHLSWKEICAVARVQTQVKKRLLLCYSTTHDHCIVILCPVSNHGRYLRKNSLCRWITWDNVKAAQIGCDVLYDLIVRTFVQEIFIMRWKPGKS